MYPIKGGGGGGGAKGRQGEGDDNRRAHAAGKTVSDNVNTGGPPYWNIAPPPGWAKRTPRGAQQLRTLQLPL